jgi:hypothetical protein
MNSTFSKYTNLSALVSTVGFAFFAGGCSSEDGDGTTSAGVTVINRSESALSAGAISSITGTYAASCDGRSGAGTDTWTLSATGGPEADELSVRTNDANCVLTLRSIIAGSDSFVGSAGIGLDTDYAVTSSAFAIDLEELAFYGNAKISSLAFAGDFSVTVLISDEPVVSGGGTTAATFSTEVSTISTGAVPASDYTIGFGSFVMEKDVNNEVVAVSGYAQLVAGDEIGQNYAIYEGALSGASTLTEVEAAFNGATESGLLSELTSLRLPVEEFDLVGTDLDSTTQRTIIVRNIEDGVASYQLIVTTFTI